MKRSSGANSGRSCNAFWCVILSAQTKKGGPQHGEFHWDSHAWHELSPNGALGNTKISPVDQAATAVAISEELRHGMEDLEIRSEEMLRKAALDT